MLIAETIETCEVDACASHSPTGVHTDSPVDIPWREDAPELVEETAALPFLPVNDTHGILG